MMLLTIFTPLYNREKTIREVYDSLMKQTNKNFEWLVINDGSTDNSDQIIKEIISNHGNEFPIRYISKPNEGLNRTINKALDLSNGILFFRLDSDDVAVSNAVDLITKYYSLIRDDKTLCSITFLSKDSMNRIIGNHPLKQIKRCNFSEYRDRYNAKGDRAEIMKLDVYRKFKFPEIENEYFCPEGLIWNRIALKYDSIYIPEAIYEKEDAEDSISRTVYDYLKKNKNGTCLYYLEIIQNKRFSFKYRAISAIKYYRYVFYTNKYPLFKSIPAIYAIIGLLGGIIVFIYDAIKH